MATFLELDLDPRTLDALDRMGYEHPTPVQTRGIPVLLAGRDVFVQAPTGTGKTATYGVPLVERWRRDGVRGLVLVPTRELAAQVAEELNALGGEDFSAVAVTGGGGWARQTNRLAEDPAVIVATPGRLIEHAEKGQADLAACRFVVLDEADRLLDMGFLGEVRDVLGRVGSPRQTALLSATLSHGVEDLVREELARPERIEVGGGEAEARLTHFRINLTRPEQKAPALIALLREEQPKRAVAFVRTRAGARNLRDTLRREGVAADALHGDLDQSQRNHFLDLFRKGTSNVLVATEVAARGLDVPEITHVVNVDLPDETEMALHRAGRAGRFGREGRVFWFVLPDEKDTRLAVEDALGGEMQPYRLPPLPKIQREPERRRGGGRQRR